MNIYSEYCDKVRTIDREIATILAQIADKVGENMCMEDKFNMRKMKIKLDKLQLSRTKYIIMTMKYTAEKDGGGNGNGDVDGEVDNDDADKAEEYIDDGSNKYSQMSIKNWGTNKIMSTDNHQYKNYKLKVDADYNYINNEYANECNSSAGSIQHICPMCNVPLLFISDDNIYMCTLCGHIISKCFDDGEFKTTSFNNRDKNQSHNKVLHFNKLLDRIQGKCRIDIDPTEFARIERDIVKYNRKIKYLNYDGMRKILRKLGMDK